ncbi:alkaline phosphatase family protein [Mucilaginibacter sp. RB4R14]|uniref:alkaline phosphatase PafA n=1 Tax=Mucilaginibacter aurantiaciroseus TaxID=2949308 RepID=UPI00209065E4|nr:alkaline phosphatase PafA [Mucilaginibacter aurantiaciroseus]MCO5936838.1 alkaline phosphatase family protein [Mucilaginibacter aurantiaciroseus]
MKIKVLLTLTFAIAVFNLSAQNKKTTVSASTTLPRPKLMVGLVVDQMRWDYLYRYYDRYQTGGFKRMLNEGFTCENTLIPYIPTVTAAGHTCIYTGSVPAIHGIAGNDFVVQATGKTMYCTDDSTVVAVGSNSIAGKMSPRNMLASTVTDELRLATNFRSKVIGIALKDRGGILPGGHAANAAYWFDDANGAWISSTYYMTELPAWVKAYNATKPAEAYLKKDWNTLYPINTYVQSAPDNSPRYEGKFSGAEAPTFPIKTSELYKGKAGMIRSTPYGNSMTLDLAKAAIENEKLGAGSVTDFLAVSLSSTDYIGHQFGPNSVEVEDTYLRLDKDLAAFFTYLDGKLGKGNYSVFLSADHGAAHNPNYLIDHNIPAGVWNEGSVLTRLNKMLEDKYKVKNLVINLGNYQVNFNNTAIKKENLSSDALKLETIQFLQNEPEIAYAVDMQRVQLATIPEDLRARIQNGYSAEHSGTIQIILKPGWYSGHGQTGTTHGTWNPYDAHIPLVFMGWGIKHGSLTRETHMTDIAATIAQLLHIQAPNGNVGTAIGEALK